MLTWPTSLFLAHGGKEQGFKRILKSSQGGSPPERYGTSYERQVTSKVVGTAKLSKVTCQSTRSETGLLCTDELPFSGDRDMRQSAGIGSVLPTSEGDESIVTKRRCRVSNAQPETVPQIVANRKLKFV